MVGFLAFQIKKLVAMNRQERRARWNAIRDARNKDKNEPDQGTKVPPEL